MMQGSTLRGDGWSALAAASFPISLTGNYSRQKDFIPRAVVVACHGECKVGGRSDRVEERRFSLEILEFRCPVLHEVGAANEDNLGRGVLELLLGHMVCFDLS